MSDASETEAHSPAGARGAPAGPCMTDSRAARGAGAKLVKTSTFRGVAATENGQWRARIRYGKHTVHLGRCARPNAAWQHMWPAARAPTATPPPAHPHPCPAPARTPPLRFREEREAALAYDRAATMLLGPGACLNFKDRCRDACAMMHTAIIIQQVEYSPAGPSGGGRVADSS